MQLEKALEALPVEQRLTADQAIKVLMLRLNTRDRAMCEGVLESLRFYGAITRPVGNGGPYQPRDVWRPRPGPAPAELPKPQRRVDIALVDEDGQIRDVPLAEHTAAVQQITRTKRRRERNRLNSLLEEEDEQP